MKPGDDSSQLPKRRLHYTYLEENGQYLFPKQFSLPDDFYQSYLLTVYFVANKCTLFIFVFARHFTSLPTCFDPCGSSSGHLIH
jgi:hypothetical protein